MLRRSILRASAFALTSLGLLVNARAATGLLPSGVTTPLEQRLAVAVGPSRTTIWTSLRVDAAPGPLGVVIPVPPGATLDHSSDAWLEALDAATAPRVFPPVGSSLVCPGAPPNPTANPFHVTSDLGKTSSVTPAESKVLSDVAAVYAWANSHNFIVSAELDQALMAFAGARFFVELFNAPGGPFVTSTLRVVMPSPSADAYLPLTLTQAAGADLRVTTWFVGAGRATLTGTTPIKLHLENLSWNANSQDSSYVDLRASELVAAGSSAVLTESASHDALVKNVSIANGTGAITGVVTGYFQRAASYLDGDANFEPCITNAAVALDSSLNVAESCPRADLGVIDGSPTCVEAPAGSQVDPDKLRCGVRADDLAIAMSGLQPGNTWLTRTTMILGKGSSGQTWPITLTPVAPTTEPLLTAMSIDFSECSSTSSSSTTSSGNPWPGGSGSSGSGSTYNPPSYNADTACGCAGTAPIIVDETGSGGSGGSGGDGGDYYNDTSSDDCSGDTTDTTYTDTTDTSSDDCSGDTTDTTYTDTTYTDTTTTTDTSSDDCGGDTSDTSETTYQDAYYADTSSSSDGVDCSSDTTDTTSDTSDTSSSESSDSDCAVARRPKAKAHQRGPKASVLTLGLLAILAPLRRLSRPRRSMRDRKDKLRGGR